jgi:hypothetical protein
LETVWSRRHGLHFYRRPRIAHYWFRLSGSQKIKEDSSQKPKSVGRNSF